LGVATYTGATLKRTFLFAALIAVAAALTYRSVTRAELVLLDDDIHITQDLYLRSGASLGAIWKEPFQGLYVPVTYTAWAAQKALFSRYWGNWRAGEKASRPLDALAHLCHWTNLLLHVGCSLLVFALLIELVGAPWAALAGALLFCVHPVQVEPIAWASGLKDLLSGFFALLAILGYLKFSRLRRAGEIAGRWYYAGATLAYGLALLSKPSAVAVPLVAAALDWGRGVPVRWALPRLAPWIAAIAPLAWITKAAQPSTQLSFVTPWLTRPLIAADSLTFYLSKVALPFGLAPDYGRHASVLLGSSFKWISWLVPLLVVALLWRRSRKVKTGFAVFVVAVLPVLGFVPFFFQEFSTVADRYLYLSMLGPAAWLAWTAADKTSWRFGAGIALALTMLAGISTRQAAHWKDSVSLFQHTLRVNPDSALAHNNLGAVLEQQGKWLEAADHYGEVIRVAPENPAGRYNYGRLLARLGRNDLAKEQLQKVVSLTPHVADAQYSLGLVLLRLNEIEPAKEHFFLAQKSRPTHPETLAYLGTAFRLQGNCEKALKYFDDALKRHPALEEASAGKAKCEATHRTT
jgi:protein O-mannosyl-transferase